ncbi:MAG: ribosome maturation factor RimM [Holosporales bacterium]|jgi:16S rRNA processing protein RimM|nr:ribosome maturation factor RimM [Holosporales bacterium]
MNPKRVCVGIVAKPVGIKGQVKIHTFTQSPNSFLEFKKFFLADEREISLESPKINEKNEIVTFLNGCKNRDEAEALRANKIYVDRNDFSALGDDEYYLADLYGLTAVDNNGVPIGVIAAAFDYGAGVFLDIKLDIKFENASKIGTVPFNKESVLDIDLENKLIILNERFILR